MNKRAVWDSIDENAGMLSEVARDIWEHPELPLEERHASELQAEVLEKAGLRVTRGLKDMPTALVAEYGKGKPVIGILGEYDALSGLSQVSRPEREPVLEGAPGHGCGHNLLGTAGVGAAIAIKEAIDREHLNGTVRYYGCPAEEELIGKIFMLRDGCFDDCDVVLYWHPSSNNAPWRVPCLAANSALFTFRGVTAHAPQAHLGRSALDAVELMNVGANYLREHLPKDVLLHYSTLGNEIAPNTVPDRCQVWYHMRAAKRTTLDAAFERLKDVARGATLMTGATLENIEILGAGNEVLPNQKLGDILVHNMNECGGPSFTEEDEEFGRKLTALFGPGQKEQGAKAFSVPEEDLGKIFQDRVLPIAGTLKDIMPASGDFDVSWKVPFGAFNCATWPIGVFTHTWQATACAGSSIGAHGMLFAAKTLAGTVWDLMTDQKLLDEVQAEFRETTKDLVYKFHIADDAVPRRVIL